ncbi:MAG: glycosyltransferase [Ilumatobacteraceae bacterium]
MATIVFFSSNAYHRKSVTRTSDLAKAGHVVHLAAFSRQSFRHPDADVVPFFDLGWSKDGGRLRRLLHVPSYLRRVIRFARQVGSADVVWANTIEMLVLARVARLFLGGPRRLVYDVADLTNIQVPQRPATRLVRSAERFLCRPLTALVVTSPWFYWKYYRDVIPNGASTFLLENKATGPIRQPSAPAPNGPWKICWHGLLRCPDTLRALAALARALPDQVEVHVWGWGAAIEADLDEVSRTTPNFHRHGEYNETEIDALFDDMHFICAFDISDGDNSRLLLPNRLYHAVARRIPCLAVDGSACGAVVEALSCGLAVGPPFADELIDLFRSMTAERYRELREAPATEVAERAVYSFEVEHIARSILGGAWVTLSPEPDVSIVLGPPLPEGGHETTVRAAPLAIGVSDRKHPAVELGVNQLAFPGYRRDFVAELRRQSGGSIRIGSGATQLEPSVTRGLEPDQVDVELFNKFFFGRRFAYQVGFLRGLLPSRVWVLELNPRIINTWLALAAARILRRRVLVWGHFRGRSLGDVGPKLGRSLQVRMANGVIAYTEEEALHFRERFPGKAVKVAPNSTDREEGIPDVRLDSSRSSFLYVGRLTGSKGVDLTLRAFAQVVSEEHRADRRLVIVGTGPEAASLRQLAVELGVEDRVDFLGESFDGEMLNELYQGAIAAVCGGYVGLNITQSLVRGVPFVYPLVSNHSPEVSLAVPGGNAFPFDPATPDALAKVLLELDSATQNGEIQHPAIQERVRSVYNVENMASGFLGALD